MNINFDEQRVCPVCEKLGSEMFPLPDYPITEIYAVWELGKINQGFLDQTMLFCEDCQHAYLQKILDVRFIYENYLTTTASSQGAISCLESFKTFVEKHLNLEDCKLLVDVGGNDSTFLSYFSNYEGIRLVNVDPNATGGSRYELNKCFLEEVDLSVFKDTSMQAIVSSHTIEHLSQPSDLIRKISSTLRHQDFLFLQFPALESLSQDLRFDQICHQHINYFSMHSIETLLQKFGLSIFDYEYDKSHFGTLRVAAKLQNSSSQSFSDKPVTMKEINCQFGRFKKYYKGLNEILEPIFEGGWGFGAGLMVPTLAYYLPVVSQLDFIVDENPSKHGKRFINLPAKIVPLEEFDIDRSVLITSISTNSAARAIFSKLVASGAKQIVLPTIIS